MRPPLPAPAPFVSLLLGLLVARLPRLLLAETCDLSWHSKQGLGFDRGVQLGVCCNASAVEIWELASLRWGNVSRLLFQHSFLHDHGQSDFALPLQLSLCSDKLEPTIGYVESRPGVRCRHLQGQTLSVPATVLPMPAWYVVCIATADGCKSCHVDVLCENDMAENCVSLYMMSSSSNSTNSSITYWVQIGEAFPFETSTKLKISIREERSRRHVRTLEAVPKAGEKFVFSVKDLLPERWYAVRRCLVFPPQRSLGHGLQYGPREICVDEAFRTEPSSAFFLSTLLVLLSSLLPLL